MGLLDSSHTSGEDIIQAKTNNSERVRRTTVSNIGEAKGQPLQQGTTTVEIVVSASPNNSSLLQPQNYSSFAESSFKGSFRDSDALSPVRMSDAVEIPDQGLTNIKIALLGSGGSGKTTLFKQRRMIYGEGFSGKFGCSC